MRIIDLLFEISDSLTYNDLELVLNRIVPDIKGIKKNGNKILPLIDFPDKDQNKWRLNAMQQLVPVLAKELGHNTHFDPNKNTSSLGGIVIDGSPFTIAYKNNKTQGTKHSGKANEIALAKLIQKEIDASGSVNVRFKDDQGRILDVPKVNRVEHIGSKTQGGLKGDVALFSPDRRIPVSIKQTDAENWETADSLFGPRAFPIIKKLINDGLVKLSKLKDREIKGQIVPIYRIDREIVVQPTPEDVLKTIFGTDINPHGGIVIQDFQPHHFVQNGNFIEIECHAVITKLADVPKSHMMYFTIRNQNDRSKTGIRGLGVHAATATRAFGKSGTKDVIYVDQEGNQLPIPKDII